jgi:hypothetical protein
MQGVVYITYRDEESESYAIKIEEHLMRAGTPEVYLSSYSEASVPVRAFADVVVAIIGKEYKTIERWRDLEEVANTGIPVIFVLLDPAVMLSAVVLPGGLNLWRRQTLRVSDASFENDIDALIKQINSALALPAGGVPDEKQIAADATVRAPPFEEKTAGKFAGTRKAATKAIAKKTPARKGVTKNGVRKRAARTAPKKTATKKPVAKKSATKKPAAKHAAKPRPAERDVASGQPRGAVNQDLSVNEMRHFASARRVDANPPRTHSETVQSANFKTETITNVPAAAVPPASAPNARSHQGFEADPLEDAVECSVFGPLAAPPGTTVLIQVFLHLASQARRVSVLASRMDSSAKPRGEESLDLSVKRGARVEIVFSANGLAVDEPVQSIVWGGEPKFRQFLATLPAGTSGQSFFPVVRVSVDGKLIGAIKFRLLSDATASQPTSVPLGDHAKRYRYAFVSYASIDRREVLKRVQMLEVTEQEYFQDILSLNPGKRWKKKLYENIDRCDVFFLFWSQAAKDSRWVRKEAKYALARQQKNPDSEPDLVPVVLEQDVPPPKSLSAFHFNDRIAYLISRKL